RAECGERAGGGGADVLVAVGDVLQHAGEDRHRGGRAWLLGRLHGQGHGAPPIPNGFSRAPALRPAPGRGRRPPWPADGPGATRCRPWPAAALAPARAPALVRPRAWP